jgi:hypothetical protein
MKILMLAILVAIGFFGWVVNQGFIEHFQKWLPVATRTCQLKDWDFDDKRVSGRFICDGEKAAITVSSPKVLYKLLTLHTDTVSCTRLRSSITDNEVEECAYPGSQ